VNLQHAEFRLGVVRPDRVKALKMESGQVRSSSSKRIKQGAHRFGFVKNNLLNGANKRMKAKSTFSRRIVRHLQ
jgi:hypothetical protein